MESTNNLIIDNWFKHQADFSTDNDSLANYKATFFCHSCQSHKQLYLKAKNTNRSKCISCDKKAKRT